MSGRTHGLAVIGIICMSTVALEAGVTNSVVRRGARFIAGETIESGTEQLIKKFGRETIEELGENGARRLTRELGEETVKEVAERFGRAGIRHIDELGEPAVRFLRRYGDDGLRLFEHNNSKTVLQLFGKYGDDLVKTVRHAPAGTVEVIARAGRPGLEVAQKYNGRIVAKYVRWHGLTARKGLGKRFTGFVSRYGGKFFRYAGGLVRKNTGKLAIAGGIWYALEHPEETEKMLSSVGRAGVNTAGYAVKKAGNAVIEKASETVAEHTEGGVWTIVQKPVFILIGISVLFLIVFIIKMPMSWIVSIMKVPVRICRAVWRVGTRMWRHLHGSRGIRAEKETQ